MKKRVLFNRKKPVKDNKPRAPHPTDEDKPTITKEESDALFLSLFGQQVEVTTRLSRVTPDATVRPRTRYSPMGRLNFDDNITSNEEDE